MSKIKDGSFKVKFNQKSRMMKVGFNASETVYDDFKADMGTCKDKDIYYDEIIYYDGGDVEGYGYD